MQENAYMGMDKNAIPRSMGLSYLQMVFGEGGVMQRNTYKFIIGFEADYNTLADLCKFLEEKYGFKVYASWDLETPSFIEIKQNA